MASQPTNTTFYIPGHVPSSKNLQRCGVTKTGKPYAYPDNRVREYHQLTDNIFAAKAEKFYRGYENGTDLAGYPNYSYPVKVGFHFIRKDNRRFDFHNALQVVADRMVHHQWIEDDDIEHFIPVPLYYAPPVKYINWEFNSGWYTVSKSNPGVCIRIIGNNATP
jgi:hypothetical protein